MNDILVRDNEGKWYVVPEASVRWFHSLNEHLCDTGVHDYLERCAEFDNDFGRYMIDSPEGLKVIL